MNTPTKPSECVAALALSEEDAQRPYLSIFYSVLEGTIYFWALTVVGITLDGENKRLIYANGEDKDTANPDLVMHPLASGVLDAEGKMRLDPRVEVRLDNEAEALSFTATLRALYQMQGELAK